MYGVQTTRIDIVMCPKEPRSTVRWYEEIIGGNLSFLRVNSIITLD